MHPRPQTYYLGQTVFEDGTHSAIFAIGQRRYEYVLTPQQIESMEYLCRKVSILKGLNYAKRKHRPMTTATT